MIAVLGAGGAVGRVLIPELLRRGEAVRAVGRSAARLQAFADSGASIATADLADEAQVRAVLRGADAAVYLAGVPYDKFELHPQLMRTTLRAARAEGVKRLLLIGTVYPYGRPQTTPVTEDHPRDPHTFKGRMRKEQEDLVLEADARGDVRAIVLRLPDFYGPGIEKSLVHDLFEAARSDRAANVIGPIDTPHEFVFIPDVAPVIADLLENPHARGVYHLAGAGRISTRDFAERVFAAAGRRMRLRVAGPLMLRALGIVNPLMRELVEMNYLQSTPVILDDAKLRRLIGSIRKTSYDEGIAQTLAAETVPA